MVSRKHARRQLHPLPLAACLWPFLLSVGCALGAIPGEVVYQDPTSFVRIEPDPAVTADEPETFHTHPATIAVEDFRAILGGFRVRDHRLRLYAMLAGEAPWEPVFSAKEIDVLAPRLSEALARAGPAERVIYYLSQPRTSIKREVTSGGFYVEGNRLHFVIANHDVQYGVPAYGVVYDRRYPMRPTSPKWFDLHFEPEGAVVEQSYTVLDFLLGGEKDEVVIDLGKLGLGLPVVKKQGQGDAVSGTERLFLSHRQALTADPSFVTARPLRRFPIYGR